MDGIGLLLIQTHYNRIYADLVQQKGLGTVAAGFVANANVKLVTMLLYYMLVVVAAYVWITFWMMVTKNKLVGGIKQVDCERMCSQSAYFYFFTSSRWSP